MTTGLKKSFTWLMILPTAGSASDAAPAAASAGGAAGSETAELAAAPALPETMAWDEEAATWGTEAAA